MSESQQSIQTVSQWTVFHWRSASDIASTWEKELFRVPLKRKMLYLYLANDIIQSRKTRKAKLVKAAFADIIPKAIHHILVSAGDDKSIRKKTSRVISIWKDRKVLSTNTISACFEVLSGKDITEIKIKKSSGKDRSSTSDSSKTTMGEKESFDYEKLPVAPLNPENQVLVDKLHDLEMADIDDRLRENTEKVAEKVLAFQNSSFSNVVETTATVVEAERIKNSPTTRRRKKLKPNTTDTSDINLSKYFVLRLKEDASLLNSWSSKLYDELQQRESVLNMLSKISSNIEEIINNSAEEKDFIKKNSEQLERVSNLEKRITKTSLKIAAVTAAARSVAIPTTATTTRATNPSYQNYSTKQNLNRNYPNPNPLYRKQQYPKNGPLIPPNNISNAYVMPVPGQMNMPPQQQSRQEYQPPMFTRNSNSYQPGQQPLGGHPDRLNRPHNRKREEEQVVRRHNKSNNFGNNERQRGGGRGRLLTQPAWMKNPPPLPLGMHQQKPPPQMYSDASLGGNAGRNSNRHQRH